jgi:hypothetical protein
MGFVFIRITNATVQRHYYLRIIFGTHLDIVMTGVSFTRYLVACCRLLHGICAIATRLAGRAPAR